MIYKDNDEILFKIRYGDIVVVNDDGEESKLSEMIKKEEYSKKHYLTELILDEDGNDDKIENVLNMKLPMDCFSQSDDLFLKIRYPNDEKMSDEDICKILEIPVKCITYTATRKDMNDRMWEVLYLTWESIAGAII